MSVVLIIDDDIDVRGMLRRLIEHNGDNVLEAESPEDAISLCHIQRPDIIILDLTFASNYMNGIDFLNKMSKDVGIIILTGNPLNNIDKYHLTNQGALYALNKPSCAKEILGTIQKAKTFQNIIKQNTLNNTKWTKLANDIKKYNIQHKTIGFIDNDITMLKMFSKIYSLLGLNVYTYLYPIEKADFLKQAKHLDYILINHRLSKANGANLAAILMKDIEVEAEIFIMSSTLYEHYKTFTYYFDKNNLIEDPTMIFRVPKDIVKHAVETSLLMQV